MENIAQLVERPIVVRNVMGSNPIILPKFKKIILWKKNLT